MSFSHGLRERDKYQKWILLGSSSLKRKGAAAEDSISVKHEGVTETEKSVPLATCTTAAALAVECIIGGFCKSPFVLKANHVLKQHACHQPFGRCCTIIGYQRRMCHGAAMYIYHTVIAVPTKQGLHS